jgi:transcriptional regulator with XRE-family HTH domain
MAAFLGMSRSALGRYLKGERTVGLDVLLLVKRKMGESIDYMVSRDPEDKRWLDPDWLPEDAPH